MSWNNYEYSPANGMPIKLYEFSRSDIVLWRYTNTDRTISFNGQQWQPEPISDSGLGSSDSQTLEITAPVSNPIV